MSRLVATSARVTISIISVIECRVGIRPNSSYIQQFNDALGRMTINSLDMEDATLVNLIVSIRQSFRLKLPDSIIAASALTRGDTLVTRDHHFTRIVGLKLETF